MTSRVTVSGRKNGVAVGEFEVLRGCKVKIGTERERERGLGRGVRRSPKKRERNGIGNVFRNRSGTVPEPKRERRTLYQSDTKKDDNTELTVSSRGRPWMEVIIKC